MKQRLKEYKKIIKNNLMRNLRRNVLFSIVFLLIFACVFPLNYLANNNYKEKTNLKNFDYSYVVETKDFDNNYRSLYKLDTLNSVTNGSFNASVNTYILPSIERKNNLFCFRLQQDEIAISRKVASELNVEIGSVIELNLVVSETPLEYKIKEIFDIKNDLYNVKKSESYSLVCFGFNQNLIETTKGRFVNFLTNEEYDDFMLNNKNYIDEHDFNDDIMYLTNRFLVFELSGLLLFIIEITLLFIYFKKSILIENKKYIFDNYSYKFINRLCKIDSLIYIMVPTLIFEVIYTICFACDLVCVTSIVVYGLVFLLIIGLITGGKFIYEKY